MSAIILNKKIWGQHAYFLRNAKNVSGNEKKSDYNLIQDNNPLTYTISLLKDISFLNEFPDIVSINLLAYCVQIALIDCSLRYGMICCL